MTDVAQAYIYFCSNRIGRKIFEDFSDSVADIALETADLYYKRRTAIEIEAADGSLKIWITIIGTLGTLIYGTHKFVVDYPSFRQGIIELCKDAEHFGYKTCASVRKLIDKQDDNKVIALSRRKAPGRIYRVLRELESFERYPPEIGSDQDLYRVEELSQQIDLAIAQLEDDEDRQLLLRNLRSRFRNMGDVSYQVSMSRKEVLVQGHQEKIEDRSAGRFYRRLVQNFGTDDFRAG